MSEKQGGGGKTQIARQPGHYLDLAITDDETTTPVIDFPFSGLTIHNPTGSGVTTFTFWSAASKKRTLLPHHDRFGDAVSINVPEGQSREVDEVFAPGVIAIVGDAAGTIDLSFKG